MSVGEGPWRRGPRAPVLVVAFGVLVAHVPVEAQLEVPVAAAGGTAVQVSMEAEGELQGTAEVGGTVLDAVGDRPVSAAEVLLRAVGSDAVRRPPRRTVTDVRGAYRFTGLARGRYELRVERLGYRTTTLEVLLERSEPVSVSVRVEPVPFPLPPIAFRVGPSRYPDLLPPAPGGRSEPGIRVEAVRARQARYLSPDVRRVSWADLRESNTLAEDDLFRALQLLPGVGSRDDYSADLWTRGGSAGQTAVLFDGIPVLGGLHALGVLTGPNTDMLAAATFQPGVAAPSSQGGGAGVVAMTTRTGMDAPGTGRVALSPLSVRFTADGTATDRVAWAVGARRSYRQGLLSLADDLGLDSDRLPFAFADLTGRVDAVLGHGIRLEASAFWQDDRVHGDVPGLVHGNRGEWGTRVVRGSLVSLVGNAVLRHTLAVSGFDASVASVEGTIPGPAPLHPPTENHYRTLLWEGRVDALPDSSGSWSVGARATREDHRYLGPGVDLARLLSPEELARRGIGDLTPVIVGLERSSILERETMTRIALWGERRHRVSDALEMEGGLRVETGDETLGGRIRLAPRLLARYHLPDSPLSVSLGAGRSWQYLQSVALTDVLRPGLRASEVLAQADEDTPALRSDLLTLGGDAWLGSSWLVGATLWHRSSSGILLPDPTPGIIDGDRPVRAATGRGRGLELSVRRLEGRVRGFANYTVSRSRHRVGARSFDATEDLRHIAHLVVVAEPRPGWQVGATVGAATGGPYTRVTLVGNGCAPGLGCSGRPPVLVGSPGLQRSPGYLGVDLSAEWSRSFGRWSLAVYGQLRNVLGRANAVTYHSSCLCVEAGSAGDGGLQDRFDRGLPRLPIFGLRARF